MYAVVRRYRFDPNNSEEINRRVRDAFVHLPARLPASKPTTGWIPVKVRELRSVFSGTKPGWRNRLASPQTLSSNIWHRCWESRRSYRARFMHVRIAVGDVQLLLVRIKFEPIGAMRCGQDRRGAKS
jgi:hypothetical protein